MTTVHLHEVEPSRTAVVAGPFDLSRFVRDLDVVYAFLAATPEVRQTGHNIALYDRGQRMEIGVEVDVEFEPVGDVVPSWLPGGRVAHATHSTGYGDLHVTYSALEAWCTEHGEVPAGLRWEIYGDPDEHDHVDVEVCFLLA